MRGPFVLVSFAARRLAAASLALLLAAAAPALAAAPLGRYVVTTATVQDTRTGLVWQRNLDPAAYSWVSAISYCRNLATAGGGWRAPSIKELQTLVDPGGAAPALDGTAFPSTPGVMFWSSTPLASDAARAWGVHFGSGHAATAAAGNASRVRCVK
jgi:hypothetical protein